MNEYTTPFPEGNMTDAQRYLYEHPDVKANWFKFNKDLADDLLFIVEETENEQGQWMLEGSNQLGYTMYAILTYFTNGELTPEINDFLYSEKSMKDKSKRWCRKLFERAKVSIDQANLQVAQNRINGMNGGRPKNQN